MPHIKASTALAEEMKVNEVVMKTAMVVERGALELIPLICDGVLTIKEAFCLLKTFKIDFVIDGRLSNYARAVLKVIRKNPEKETPSGKKIIGVWDSGGSIEELLNKIRKAAMSKDR